MKRGGFGALLVLILFSAFLLSGCSQNPKEFTVKVRCESTGIYQIFYTCYIDGESCGMGGMADLNGGEITAETDLTLTFTESYLEGKDISRLAIDFSPYGKDDTSEIATTEKVYIDAEYGNTYTVVFSGDEDSGFTAQLQD